MRHLVAEAEDLREDEVEDREQHQRPQQRPDVAEHRPEEGELEVGDGDQPQEAEEARAAAAVGGRALYLAEGWDVALSSRSRCE